MHRKAILLVLILVCAFLFSGATRGTLSMPLEKPAITVYKQQRELQLFSGEKLVKKYRIALGTSPVGPKTRAGDRRTPEGKYYVCIKNPNSAYYLSLGISYPNISDAESAFKRGQISKGVFQQVEYAIKKGRIPPWHSAMGGEIFIHGNGSTSDWTWGCVALEDEDMAELYDAIPIGTPVTILP